MPQPPADRLALCPKIASCDDVDRALRELSWIDAEAKRLEAACQRDVAALKAKAQAAAVCTVDETELTLEDRRRHLSLAVIQFAAQKRGELLEGSAKHRVFTHGTIGWRQPPAKLEFLDGESEKTLLEKAGRACNLLVKLRELLAKLFPVPKIAGDLIFDLKLSLNKTRVKKLADEKKLTSAQLKKLGLAVVVPDELCYVDVNDYPVQREAAS